MLPGVRALRREWPPAVKWREEKRSYRILPLSPRRRRLRLRRIQKKSFFLM